MKLPDLVARLGPDAVRELCIRRGHIAPASARERRWASEGDRGESRLESLVPSRPGRSPAGTALSGRSASRPPRSLH